MIPKEAATRGGDVKSNIMQPTEMAGRQNDMLRLLWSLAQPSDKGKGAATDEVKEMKTMTRAKRLACVFVRLNPEEDRSSK